MMGKLDRLGIANAKSTNAIAKSTNAIAESTNVIAKSTNAIAKSTNAIAESNQIKIITCSNATPISNIQNPKLTMVLGTFFLRFWLLLYPAIVLIRLYSMT
jgi:hypothetical protein